MLPILEADPLISFPCFCWISGAILKRGADIICPPPLSGPIFYGVQSDIGCNNDSNLGWARPKSLAIWDQYIGGGRQILEALIVGHPRTLGHYFWG